MVRLKNGVTEAQLQNDDANITELLEKNLANKEVDEVVHFYSLKGNACDTFSFD